ncbi:MAG: hypothetical protein JSV91_12410 [Phycisphaerales bacterium]|nr:MAG: hypothetical protein JSV91_12410 [Phycisphaerales bacterium]
MHVALIVDEERLLHEHLMLNRLSIGLIDEGVQITRMLPEELPSQQVYEGEQRMALATRLEYPVRVPPWMRRRRAQRLAEAMEKSLPDVIYAVGERTWPVALELSDLLRRPVAIDVWKAKQVRRVPAGRSGHSVAAYLCPTAPIAASLRDRVGHDLVSMVPMGVAAPRDARTIMAGPEESITLAIIGSGQDLPAYRAMLGGLSRVLRDLPQAQAFLELRGPHEHEIWRLAQRLELLAQVSTITDAASHRPALLCCDVLVVPEREGEMRSLLLEAMAGAMAVAAAADPALDFLVHDQTAGLVEGDTAEAWREGLDRVLNRPDFARQLGAAARDHVLEHQRSSEQVSRLVDTFEKAVAGDAISFARASS